MRRKCVSNVQCRSCQKSLPQQRRCCTLAAALLLLAAAARTDAARKVWATVPYTFEGSQTVLGPGGVPDVWSIGSQVLSSHALRSTSEGGSGSSGSGDSGSLGTLSGHCHVVARAAAGAWRAVCTLHYDWRDGSTMTGHATVSMRPDGAPVSADVVVAGGIGRWEGAHGEDMAWRYDPRSGRGSGRIVLTCLKGRC